MRKAILYTFLIFTHFLSIAQEKDTTKQHHLNISTGLNLIKFVDESNSYAPYKGDGVAAGIGYSLNHNNFQYSSRLDYTYSINSSFNTPYQTKSSSHIIRLDNKFTWHILNNKLPKKLTIEAGSILNASSFININDFLYNANVNYYGMLNTGGIVKLGYDIFWNNRKSKLKKIKFYSSTTIPFIFFYVRPEYNLIQDFTNGSFDNINVKDFSFTSFNKILRFKNMIGFEYKLKSKNSIRIEYQFCYTKIDEGYNLFILKENQIKAKLNIALN